MTTKRSSERFLADLVQVSDDDWLPLFSAAMMVGASHPAGRACRDALEVLRPVLPVKAKYLDPECPVIPLHLAQQAIRGLIALLRPSATDGLSLALKGSLAGAVHTRLKDARILEALELARKSSKSEYAAEQMVARAMRAKDGGRGRVRAAKRRLQR